MTSIGTSIGILGAGRVARPLANALSEVGHTVVMGALDTERGEWSDWAADRGIRLTTQVDAARSGELVIDATPGEHSVTVLTRLADELRGKVLIDVANATVHGSDGLRADLRYPGGSLAAEIQRALPETKVVKTLNTMMFTVQTAPRSLAVRSPRSSPATTARPRQSSPICSATSAGPANGSSTSVTCTPRRPGSFRADGASSVRGVRRHRSVRTRTGALNRLPFR